MDRKKNLFLAFDAFGTLFTPRRSIAAQYGELARRHGLTGFTDEDVQFSFRKAFKEASKEHPNYGKAVGMKAPAWWANVITKTFKPFTAVNESLPSQLVPELLTRFSTQEGYSIYPDVLPFFARLRTAHLRPGHTKSNNWPYDRTIVGVITNSDDRIPGILSSFGLRVGSRRVGSGNALASADDDISFVVLSYDVGHEKPDRRVFDAAQNLLREMLSDSPKSGDFDTAEDFDLVYVGDDLEKDVLGAEDAYWKALLIDRAGRCSKEFKDRGGDPTIEVLADHENSSRYRRVKVIRDLNAFVDVFRARP
ncbi:hypothetical protein LTR04_000913 [Oleoguttula sp. CCFEE 6159]|nr:hypothetical protein LTR04_000913 [Oleoguttula sp. CCFEE 6159]